MARRKGSLSELDRLPIPGEVRGMPLVHSPIDPALDQMPGPRFVKVKALIISGVLVGTASWLLWPALGLGGAPEGSPVEQPSPPSPSVEAAAFSPPIFKDGQGRTVLPMTFPEGTSVDLVFPRSLDVRVNELTASSSVFLGEDSADADVARSLLALYGPPEAYGLTSEVIERFPRSDDVAAEHRAGVEEAGSDFMVFQIDGWSVFIHGAELMSRQERLALASSFDGHVTDSGFLVLEPVPPLFQQRPGGHEGPALEMQGRTSEYGAFTLTVQLAPGCRSAMSADPRNVEISELGASWCAPGFDLYVHAAVETADNRGVLRELVGGVTSTAR